MILRTWAENLEGETVDLTREEVGSREEATATLVDMLTETASDEFLHKALEMWFTQGKVSHLHEGGDQYWNVALSDY